MSIRLEVPPQLAGLSGLDLRRLRERAEALLEALGHGASELSITLGDDARVAELNARYRRIDGPTDVLSFSLVEGEHAAYRGSLLGDVVIGLGVAERQAAQAGRSLDDEVAILLIHGVLHLLGHDHREAEEARWMRAEEGRLWKLIDP